MKSENIKVFRSQKDESGNILKDSDGKKIQELVWEGAYFYPENLEEALETDGEEKIYKTYMMKRKSDFMDAKRRPQTQKLDPAIVGAIKKVLAEKNDEKLAQLAELLGLSVEMVLQMI